MPSLNKCFIAGHLGKDPTMNPQGSIVNFSIATSEKWTDKKTGEAKEKTEWHRIVAFGRQAEYCSKYLQKGSPVFVEGKIQTREWTDKTGEKRYTTEIVASSVSGLGGGERRPRDVVDTAKAVFGSEVEQEDIPF